MALLFVKEATTSQELVNTKLRSLELNEKFEKLTTENELLTQELIASQIKSAEISENVLRLKNEKARILKLIESDNATTDQINEQIDAILTVFREKNFTLDVNLISNEVLNHDLQEKDDQVLCLQDCLLKLRLKEAEKFNDIRELKKQLTELENDKKLLGKRPVDTNFELQEELIAAKGRTLNQNFEFKKIKKAVKNLKNNVELYQETYKKTEDESVEGVTTWSKFGVKWMSNESVRKIDEDVHLTEINQLEIEQKCLQNMIPGLETQMKIINRQIEAKEKIQKELELQAVEHEIRQTSNLSILKERQRQCEQLIKCSEESSKEIQGSIEDKIANIESLNERINQLSCDELVDTSSTLEEDMVADLETEVFKLESKIKELKKEILPSYIVLYKNKI